MPSLGDDKSRLFGTGDPADSGSDFPDIGTCEPALFRNRDRFPGDRRARTLGNKRQD